MRANETPWLAMALNNAWANATLYRAIQTLPDGAFIAPRPGFFQSLSATMNHIYAVDLFYLDALEAGDAGRSVYERDAVVEPELLERVLSHLLASADDVSLAVAARVCRRWRRLVARLVPLSFWRTALERNWPGAAEELGGAALHCGRSGVTDYFAEDDEHALEITRRIVKGLPWTKPTNVSWPSPVRLFFALVDDEHDSL